MCRRGIDSSEELKAGLQPRRRKGLQLASRIGLHETPPGWLGLRRNGLQPRRSGLQPLSLPNRFCGLVLISQLSLRPVDRGVQIELTLPRNEWVRIGLLSWLIQLLPRRTGLL